MQMTKAKAVVAAVGAVLTVASGALADDVLDVSETASLIAAVLSGAATVYAVYRVPNKPVQ